jgi:hypothetical protein
MGFWKKMLGLETTASTAATAMSTTIGEVKVTTAPKVAKKKITTKTKTTKKVAKKKTTKKTTKKTAKRGRPSKK